MLRSVKIAWAAFSTSLLLTAAANAQSSVFTYQGSLDSNGSPANGSYDIRFQLFNAASAGEQQGSIICSDNVGVADGLFTVQLDFGTAVFSGDDRWLQISIRSDSTVGNCGGGSYTMLTTRQRVTATPYALQAQNLTLPFSGTTAAPGSAFTVASNDPGGTALYGYHTSAAGVEPAVVGESHSVDAFAVALKAIVVPTNPGFGSTAVRGINNGTGFDGVGIWGSHGGHGTGVLGTTNGVGYGVKGSAGDGGTGVLGLAGAAGIGVYGGGEYGVRATGVTRGIDAEANALDAVAYGVYSTVSSTAGDSAGVYGANTANSGYNFGVVGELPATTGGSFSAAVRGINRSTTGGGIGVWGSHDGGGLGGYFTSNSGTAVVASTVSDGNGVFASAGAGGTGVHAAAPNHPITADAYSFSGLSFGVDSACYSSTFESAGVRGINASDGSQVYGVLGEITSPSTGASSAAVRGKNAGTGGAGIGVWGTQNGSGYGVLGTVGGAGIGVIGIGGTGIAVEALGTFIATGAKLFRIDHPFDPEHKYLQHYCAEGPEPINAYRGTVVTDAGSEAWVTLPDYFSAINRDPHVQLTVVDENDFAMVRLAREVADNRFLIKTSRPNVKVFWRVEAVRNDLWIRQRGAPVEIEKPQHEQGTYQHPELYGLGPERGLPNLHENGAPQQSSHAVPD